MATHDGLKLIAAGVNQLPETGTQVTPRYLSIVLFFYISKFRTGLALKTV